MEGPELSVVRAPDPDLVKEIDALLDGVARSTGHAAVSEHKRTATLVAAGGRSSAGGEPHLVAGIVARDVGRPELVGYAPLVGDRRTHQYAVEMALAPSGDAPALADALVAAASDVVVGNGGGTLRLWIARASSSDDDRARAHGFRAERDLVQMRCPLPLPGGRRGPAIPTRPFRPGLDEEGWLRANNRAFASHPEQGHWDLATLVEREKEPWFDPDGLRILEADGRVAGSCWTKVHAHTTPPMGEIYVIGVDPDFHGRGWGRALTEAGLDWLSRRGLTVGMLYVDAGNVAAVSLYRSMGFADDHVDRAYIGSFG